MGETHKPTVVLTRLAFVVLVLLACLAVSIPLNTYRESGKDNQPNTTAKSPEPKPDTPKAQTAQTTPAVSSTPAPKPPTTSATVRVAAATAKTAPAAPDTRFLVSNVVLNDAAWYCAAPGWVNVSVASSGITFLNASHGGGDLKWEWLRQDAGGPVLTDTNPAVVTIAANTTNFIMKAGNAALLDENIKAKDSTTSFRIHIIAPNEMFSPWFVVPAISESVCP